MLIVNDLPLALHTSESLLSTQKKSNLRLSARPEEKLNLRTDKEFNFRSSKPQSDAVDIHEALSLAGVMAQMSNLRNHKLISCLRMFKLWRSCVISIYRFVVTQNEDPGNQGHDGDRGRGGGPPLHHSQTADDSGGLINHYHEWQNKFIFNNIAILHYSHVINTFIT